MYCELSRHTLTKKTNSCVLAFYSPVQGLHIHDTCRYNKMIITHFRRENIVKFKIMLSEYDNV